MDPKATRGYANCNPGNMDRSEPPWNGEIRVPADVGAGPADFKGDAQNIRRGELLHGRFCVFVDATHGIRAMAKNLMAYYDKLSLHTIRQIINRWAPPSENNTEGYIQRVAGNAGVGADDQIDIRNPRILGSIIDGIIRVECAGQPYTGTEIEDGMLAAGIS